MNIPVYDFQGTVWYAWLGKKDQYDKYSIRFYPKDDTTRKAIAATGTRCKVKEDDRGFYFSFANRNNQPILLDDKGNQFEEILGHGTEAEITLSVEEFNSVKHGKVVRTLLEAVRVLKLVPYVRKEETDAPEVTEGLPT